MIAFTGNMRRLKFLLAALLLFAAATEAWTSAGRRGASKSCGQGISTHTVLFSTSSSDTSSPPPIDTNYYTFLEPPVLTQNSKVNGGAPPVTLTRYLAQEVKDHNELRDLESLLLAVQMACKTISNLINRAGLVWDHTERDASPSSSTSSKFGDGRYYSMKRLDQLSTIVLKNALKYTGKCEVVAPAASLDDESPAQHQPGVLIAKSLADDDRGSYVACLDPLDGSGNADASICTGTIFGVFEQQQKDDTSSDKSDEDLTQQLVESVLQPAKNMRAAGYCLYSSATVLVFSLGESVQGFTLDPQINEFVLTHPNLTIPSRGNVYSCNEGNSEGWDVNYKEYLRNIKTGQGQTGQRYAHRYVGSMVGDIHRTLLYGGIFAYPADTQSHPAGNLQLLYKTAPMAFVVHHAGGTAIDGTTGSLLDVKPERVHQKTPCFLGSPEDVAELESYLKKGLQPSES